MRTRSLVSILLSTALLAIATSKDGSVDELKARLQATTSPDERAKLSIDIAERQVSAADKLFQEGKTEVAQAAVHDVALYSGQARDVAVANGHHAKNIEISLRKMIHRLSDMKRTLSFEEQAPVQSAIDQMETMRTDLLNRMFKDKK